jgi:hypothetical protein
MYSRLKQLHSEVKSHADLTYRSAPFFAAKLREIKVELLKVSMAQGEQISRDVNDAIRFIEITEREDLNMIQAYPKEVPKYLGRVKETVVSKLAFAAK